MCHIKLYDAGLRLRRTQIMVRGMDSRSPTSFYRVTYMSLARGFRTFPVTAGIFRRAASWQRDEPLHMLQF